MKLPLFLPRFLALSIGLNLMGTSGSLAADQVVRGHVPAAVAHLRPAGTLENSKRLDLAIGLPLRHRESLTNLLRDLYDPGSPSYHHYLTAAEFAEQFGPSQEDYQAVEKFAQAHGLTVTARHGNRTLLDVSGAVADIEKTMHLHLRVFHHPTEARDFFAPDVEPSIDLAVPILGISGLDNFVRPRPMNLNATAFHAYTDTNAASEVTGSGPGGNFLGNDFREAYAPNVALTGAGQSIGLFELDGYFPSDISKYEILAKLPNVPLTNILLDGFSGAAGYENIEVALDIDMAICMAPGLLQVMVYEGTSPHDVLNRMATDNQAKQLSSSWGFGLSIDPVRDQIYQQFAAQGQTMFQASGDSGAYSGQISAPSDNPNVTVVGGTTLTTVGLNGQWADESVWPGSGGGISTTFPIPSWQQSVSMTANHGSTTMRNIPDVSCIADILIWLIAENGRQGPIGGSSASTPLWAGFMALVNQQVAANGRPTLGFINPALYAIGQSSAYALAFHDITNGNNISSANPSNFFAVRGYDLCTGWGSPAGGNLINALVSPPDALMISPAANLVFNGPVGGPFLPATQNFVLTNAGTNLLFWGLGGGAGWLTVSSPNGVLASHGADASVTLTVNSNAAALPAGIYLATLSFTNLADGFVQNRNIVLDVVAAPIIVQQPVSQTGPPGGAVIFTVTALGRAPLSYQWKWDATNLMDGVNIAGSSSSALTLMNLAVSNAGTYSAVVSNTAGSAASASVLLTVPSLTSPGATFSDLYFFTDGTDGGLPNGLIQASDGNFYGTAQMGGAGAAGTIFQMTPTGTVTTLDSFGALPGAGAVPSAALVQGSDGSLYGVTEYGGTLDDGTIFRVATNGTLTTLVQLNDNGAFPLCALIQGADGNFYGTTVAGGAQQNGITFSMTTNGILTTLASFSGPNGLNPSELVQTADGSFYGTTFDGGLNGNGTIFQLTTNAGLTTLVSLNYTNGGSLPVAGLVQTPDGNFYGTTYEGGAHGFGTVFEMSPTGALNTLYSFANTGDGRNPAAGLVTGPDGNFYGTTAYGGAYDDGTIFRIAPNGALTTLKQFDGYDGANPEAALTLGADGNIYGTAQFGGPEDAGVIFSVNMNVPVLQITAPPASQDAFTGAKVVFSIAVIGNPPLIYQWKKNGVALTNGANVSGATARVLTLFDVTTADSAIYSVVVSNATSSVTSDGATLGVIVSAPQIVMSPASQTQIVGGTAVFSVTAVGSLPLSYQWRENGANLADGGQISGSASSSLTIKNLVETNDGAYSVVVNNTIASATSDSALLTVYGASASGTTLAALHSFAGGIPNGLAVGSNGLLYGTTQNGVTPDYGMIYSISSIGAFTPLAVFNGANGSMCPASLTQAINGNWYGVTESGGTNFTGNIFDLAADDSINSIYSFPGSGGGESPYTALVPDKAGKFYGASKNTNGSLGNIFKMTPDGNVNTIYSFTGGADGTLPADALALGPDGNFYGLTSGGAAHGFGGVFRMTPAGALTNLYSFTGGTDGSVPSGQLALNSDGTFYGVTRRNTISGFSFYGTIFTVTTTGKLNTLYSFNFNDGAFPFAGMILASDGNFYGTTFTGLGSQDGTVFRITPGGAFTTLVSFNGSDDGSNPESALVEGTDGSLYGTTTSGGPGGHGTVFRLSFTSAPQILTQPASQTNVAGSAAMLYVTTFGATPLSYQWQLNGVDLTGANSRVLTLNNLAATSAGTYSVTVSNAQGIAVSAGAVLSVEIPPAFLAAAPSGGTLVLTWSVTPGKTYQLQSSANLSQATWTNLGGPMPATNSAMSAADNLSPAGQKFYRVQRVP